MTPIVGTTCNAPLIGETRPLGYDGIRITASGFPEASLLGFKNIACDLVTCDRLIIHNSQRVRRQNVGSMRSGAWLRRNGRTFARRKPLYR